MSKKTLFACAVLAACGLCVSMSWGALLARWRFEEPAGATIVHGGSIGKTQIIGTLLGSAHIVVGGGIDGNCLQLDSATNDLVDNGMIFGDLGSRCFTITAWVKTTMTGTGFAVAAHNSGFVAGYFMGLNTSGTCYGAPNKAYMYVSSDCNVPVSTVTINNAIWHHIAMVYTPGIKATLYVDGDFQSSTPAPVYTFTNASLLFGGIVVGGVKTNSFTGSIDDVRIYDRALGPVDISILAHQIGSDISDACAYDLNCTGSIDGLDLATFLGQWTGSTMYSPCPPFAPADFNQDCKVNGLDLSLLLGAWGSCPGF